MVVAIAAAAAAAAVAAPFSEMNEEVPFFPNPFVEFFPSDGGLLTPLVAKDTDPFILGNDIHSFPSSAVASSTRIAHRNTCESESSTGME